MNQKSDGLFGSERLHEEKTLLKERLRRTFFSEFVLSQKSAGKQIAYIALMTALCTALNGFLTIPNPVLIGGSTDVISLCLALCMLAGATFGPVYGFSIAFVSDLLCYFLFSSRGYPYFPWVGLSKAFAGFISGFIMCNVKIGCKGGVYIKALIACVLVLFVCSAGIETGGYFLYNKYVKKLTFKTLKNGFWKVFGIRIGEVTYGWYVFYRLIIRLCVINNIVNTAAFLLFIPAVNSIKGLKIKIK